MPRIWCSWGSQSATESRLRRSRSTTGVRPRGAGAPGQIGKEPCPRWQAGRLAADEPAEEGVGGCVVLTRLGPSPSRPVTLEIRHDRLAGVEPATGATSGAQVSAPRPAHRRRSRPNSRSHHRVVLALRPLVAEAGLLEERASAVLEPAIDLYRRSRPGFPRGPQPAALHEARIARPVSEQGPSPAG